MRTGCGKESHLSENVFTWRGYGGDWNDPANWTSAVYDGPGLYQPFYNYQLTDSHVATRAPGAGDTVVFAYGPVPDAEHNPQNGWNLVNGGMPSGGGEAARLLMAPDWTPIALTGTGTEHYRIGSIEIHDRILAVDNAVLDADQTHLDPTSTLQLDRAATEQDQYGRSVSADLGDLTLDEGGGWGGVLLLGDHNADVISVQGDTTQHPYEDYFNFTGSNPRFGVYGTGHLYFPPSAIPGFHIEGANYTQSGDSWSIDLGTIAQGADLGAFTVDAANLAPAGADSLSGDLQVTGEDAALQAEGSTTVPSIGPGEHARNLTFDLDTSIAGEHSLDIVLHSIDAAAGDARLPDQRLTIHATVAASPQPSEGTDWNALAARVMAAFDATGSWYVPGEEGANPPSSGEVDWNALAAEVTRHYAETGAWF